MTDVRKCESSSVRKCVEARDDAVTPRTFVRRAARVTIAGAGVRRAGGVRQEGRGRGRTALTPRWCPRSSRRRRRRTVQSFPVTVTALGLVGAAPGHVAELASPAQARVVRIFVTTGQAVRAGEPLVALDQTVFAAEVRRTDVARVTAQQAYDRARRLVDAGILPQEGRRVGRRRARRRQRRHHRRPQQQRRFVYLAVALLSAAGIWAAMRLPSAIYPELEFSRVTIVVQGTSLGARQVLFSDHAADRGGREHRARRDARAVAFDSRRSETNVTFAPAPTWSYALQQDAGAREPGAGDLPAGSTSKSSG
jgi:multidrug efflux pump subunit AcrA (membrane-fusion protein)